MDGMLLKVIVDKEEILFILFYNKRDILEGIALFAASFFIFKEETRTSRNFLYFLLTFFSVDFFIFSSKEKSFSKALEKSLKLEFSEKLGIFQHFLNFHFVCVWDF